MNFVKVHTVWAFGKAYDATFITADPGHAKADKPRGGEAKTRRSKDGTWAKKNGKSYFGYKLHSKMDTEHGLIRDIETTTASVHDSQVDLSNPGEVVYRDKGYFGVKPEGYDATMKRATRGHPLDIRDELRNRRINKKRAPDRKDILGCGSRRGSCVSSNIIHEMVWFRFLTGVG